MADNHVVKQIFVNLPIKDLKKSVDFFTKLGFSFNPKFTNEDATCMILGENFFSMLLVEKFFKGFITKEIADSKTCSEAIISLAVESREKVDWLFDKAIQAGASVSKEGIDLGWMYQKGFQDLDGHLWEVFYMDESKMPQEMKDKT